MVPHRGPRLVGVGDPVHGIKGSKLLGAAAEIRPGGGGSVPMEDLLPHWVPLLQGRCGRSRSSVLTLSTVTGPCKSLCALVAGFLLSRFGSRACLSHRLAYG